MIDWRLLALAAPGIVAMAGVTWLLTGWLGSMPGYFGAILCYNLLILLPLCLWRLGPRGIASLLSPKWPGAWIGGLLLLIPVGLFGMLMFNGGVGALPAGALTLIVLVSLTNGTLEEVFWRGALLRSTAWPALIVALVAFTAWHRALIPAQGVTLTGGTPALLAGAFGLGLIWSLARVRSGTVGAAAISHVGVNLFAFADLWALHLPAP